MPQSEWEASLEFEVEGTAFDLGISKAEFLLWSPEDKAQAVQYRRSKNMMEAYEIYLAEEKAKQQAKRKR